MTAQPARRILISDRAEILVGPEGWAPVGVDKQAETALELEPGLYVERLSHTRAQELAEALGGELVDARRLLGDRTVARALALLHFAENTRFDPFDGSAVTIEAGGRYARSTQGRKLFPRVDPAVIGLITHPEQEAILLGRNARRPGYFSLIAGYVDPGETLEEAFRREVWEESARRISSPRYWGSQPWAVSGSLMVGFIARAEDIEPQGQTDGELAETRWVTRSELAELSIAPEGSIAHKLINQWARREIRR